MSDTQPKIAVIGPTESGKTCLAVGLYRTSRPTLTISPNEETLGCLKAYTVEIESGKWPDGTLPGTEKTLQAAFNTEGRSMQVSFPEFAGERLQGESFKAFANAHFRGLDGVVLLVNPGAGAFEPGNPQLSEDTLSQYGRIVNFLGDPNNAPENGAKPFVALTVTAADRLDGDLKGEGGRLRLFRKCLDRIGHSLRTKRFSWKTFRVTVTGPQNPANPKQEPKLGDQEKITAAEPFVWLLKQIADRPRRARRRKMAKVWGGVLLAALLGGGLKLGFDRAKQGDSEGLVISKCEKALAFEDWNVPPSAADLAGAREAFEGLRGTFKTKTNARRAADLIAEKGPAASERFQAGIKRLIEDFDGGGGGEIEKLFAAWAVVWPEAAGESDKLKQAWHVRRGEVAADRGDLKGLAAMLPGRVETNRFLTAEFAERLWEERFKDGFEAACGLYLDKRREEIKERGVRPLLTAKDESEIRLDGAGIGEPFDAEKIIGELRELVGRDAAEWDARIAAERERFRRVCEKWVAGNVKPDRPRVVKGLLREYFDAREHGELSDFDDICDEIARPAVYRQVGEWLEKDVADYAAKGGCALFGDDGWSQGQFEKWYADFKDTCLAIAEDDLRPDTTSWVYQFARICKEAGNLQKGKTVAEAFPQMLVLTRVDCRMDYHGNFPKHHDKTEFTVEFLSRDADEESPSVLVLADGFGVKKEDARKWVTVWEDRLERQAGLFLPMGLRVTVNDDPTFWNGDGDVTETLVAERIPGRTGNPFGGQPPCWTMERVFHLRANGRDSGDEEPAIGIKVYGTWEGETPATLLEKAKRNAGAEGE